MDEIALRKALAALRAFADNVPTKYSTIDVKYVDLFHTLLTDVGREMEQDLSYFRVPPSEARKRWVGSSGDNDFYTDDPKVDTEMLQIKLNGALNFIASFLGAPERRIIGFAP